MTDKTNKRWQRQNRQHHLSRVERMRIAQEAAKRMEPAMESVLGMMRRRPAQTVTFRREQVLESWDIADGPSRSYYTFHAPPSHGHKRVVHRLFSEMEFKIEIDPETVEAMRLAGEKLERTINQLMCARMGIPPHFLDMGQPKPEPPPKPEPTTEVLIDGKWVPVQQE